VNARLDPARIVLVAISRAFSRGASNLKKQLVSLRRHLTTAPWKSITGALFLIGAGIAMEQLSQSAHSRALVNWGFVAAYILLAVGFLWIAFIWLRSEFLQRLNRDKNPWDNPSNAPYLIWKWTVTPGIGLLLGFAIIVTVLFHRDKLSSFLDTVNSHETKPGPIPSATAPSSTSASPTSLLSPNAASPTPPPPPTGRVQRQSISEAAPTPAAFSSADANERARRQQIIASLRKEYVEELTKRRFIVRDGFLWRNEIPPTAWTNEKLREMGESWSIKNRYTDMQTDQLRNAAAKFITEIKNISSGFPQAARDLHQERLKQLNAAKT